MHHNFHPLQASSTRSRTIATVRMIVLCYLCTLPGPFQHATAPLPSITCTQHMANPRTCTNTYKYNVCMCMQDLWPAFVISLYSYINILTYPFLSQAVCYHRFFSSYRANLRCAWSFGRRIRLQKYWPRCTRHEAGHVDLCLCRNDWKPLVAGRVAICRDLRPTFYTFFDFSETTPDCKSLQTPFAR